jgi:hypothetical protein
VVRCVLELSSESEGCYNTYLEESEHEDAEIIIIVIGNERNSCFHMAITSSNTNIENAKAVCCQAVLYRSTEDDCNLYYAVHDSHTQRVFFCLCNPLHQEFEDVSCYSMQGETDKIVYWLKTYTTSNAEVLRRPKGITKA